MTVTVVVRMTVAAAVLAEVPVATTMAVAVPVAEAVAVAAVVAVAVAVAETVAKAKAVAVAVAVMVAVVPTWNHARFSGTGGTEPIRNNNNKKAGIPGIPGRDSYWVPRSSYPRGTEQDPPLRICNFCSGATLRFAQYLCLRSLEKCALCASA